MNAQSSRSHAIFSLTLTQRKFTGSGPPPRSSSPVPPGGRSPSRIARPGSVIGHSSASRVASPTFGRPATPSFQSAIARGSRPASSLGFLSPDMARNGSKDGNEGGSGEWVTITSKFHFVDLAGSERVCNCAFTRHMTADISIAQTHGCRGRADQGRHFHQQRSSRFGKCYLCARRPRESEVEHGLLHPLS